MKISVSFHHLLAPNLVHFLPKLLASWAIQYQPSSSTHFSHCYISLGVPISFSNSFFSFDLHQDMEDTTRFLLCNAWSQQDSEELMLHTSIFFKSHIQGFIVQMRTQIRSHTLTKQQAPATHCWAVKRLTNNKWTQIITCAKDILPSLHLTKILNLKKKKGN